MDFTSLIPEYKIWKENNLDFTIIDYLGVKSSYEQILIASKLFFPDLFITNGLVLLKESCQLVNAESFWTNTKTLADFERTINFVCLGNIISITNEQDLLLCKETVIMIKKSWDIFFKCNYSDYDLVSDIYEDEFDGWCVTFFQRKNITLPKPQDYPLKNISYVDKKA